MTSSTAPRLIQLDTGWKVSFEVMASPCEVLLESSSQSEAITLASLSYEEALRIERKFSRYREDSIVYAINTSCGKPVPIDDETYRMLTYAGQGYTLSDGLFDITSGVLRKAWAFNGREVEPNLALIESLLTFIGWNRVKLDRDNVLLPLGMEIDLGGIGKEYAVDRVAELISAGGQRSVMVNFGGDIRAISAPGRNQPWVIGIESPDQEGEVSGTLEVISGAVATSGDARRFCFHHGRRLGHILNPRTGWPVEDAPRSVTVAARLCTEAGLLATLAMLQGLQAESFLDAQNVLYHCIW